MFRLVWVFQCERSLRSLNYFVSHFSFPQICCTESCDGLNLRSWLWHWRSAPAMYTCCNCRQLFFTLCVFISFHFISVTVPCFLVVMCTWRSSSSSSLRRCCRCAVDLIHAACLNVWLFALYILLYRLVFSWA